MFEGPLRTKSKLTDSSNWYWERCIHIQQVALPSRMAAAVWVAECEYFKGDSQVSCPPFREFLKHRRAKCKLAKTTFNVESFMHRLSRSISSDFSAIRFWNVCHSQKSPKKSMKTSILDIQGHPSSLLSVPIKASVRLPISDYQQPRPYLAPFLRYSDLFAENRKFFPPPLI